MGVLGIDLFLQFYWRQEGRGVANSGISFGVFQGIGGWLLLMVWIMVVVWYGKRRDRSGAIFLIVMGGAGNLIARLFLGGIWDYIYLPFLPFWFNLSDVLISWGVISYILGGNEDRDTI